MTSRLVLTIAEDSPYMLTSPTSRRSGGMR